MDKDKDKDKTKEFTHWSVMFTENPANILKKPLAYKYNKLEEENLIKN